MPRFVRVVESGPAVVAEGDTPAACNTKIVKTLDSGSADAVCIIDGLDQPLAGQPIGRIVGPEAMRFGGWQRLNAEDAELFGVETPGWPSNAPHP